MKESEILQELESYKIYLGYSIGFILVLLIYMRYKINKIKRDYSGDLDSEKGLRREGYPGELDVLRAKSQENADLKQKIDMLERSLKNNSDHRNDLYSDYIKLIDKSRKEKEELTKQINELILVNNSMYSRISKMWEEVEKNKP